MCKDEHGKPIINKPFSTNFITTYVGINDYRCKEVGDETFEADCISMLDHLSDVRFNKLNLRNENLFAYQPFRNDTKDEKGVKYEFGDYFIIDHRYNYNKPLTSNNLNEIMLSFEKLFGVIPSGVDENGYLILKTVTQPNYDYKSYISESTHQVKPNEATKSNKKPKLDTDSKYIYDYLSAVCSEPFERLPNNSNSCHILLSKLDFIISLLSMMTISEYKQAITNSRSNHTYKWNVVDTLFDNHYYRVAGKIGDDKDDLVLFNNGYDDQLYKLYGERIEGDILNETNIDHDTIYIYNKSLVEIVGKQNLPTMINYIKDARNVIIKQTPSDYTNEQRQQLLNKVIEQLKTDYQQVTNKRFEENDCNKFVMNRIVEEDVIERLVK
jgi:hypothetical protein